MIQLDDRTTQARNSLAKYTDFPRSYCTTLIAQMDQAHVGAVLEAARADTPEAAKAAIARVLENHRTHAQKSAAKQAREDMEPKTPEKENDQGPSSNDQEAPPAEEPQKDTEPKEPETPE